MNIKNKVVAVTGGAGFIGSHLVDRLVKERPEKIIVLSNFFLGNKDNLKNAKEEFGKLEIKNVDVAERSKLRKLFNKEGIDVVFNLAVIPLLTSLEKPEWCTQQNVNMTLNICELAREDKFKQLVQFSSSEAYGTAKYVPMDELHPINPETPYAASKAATDHITLSYQRTFGIKCSVVRPFNNYGPRQNPGKFAGIIPFTIKRLAQNKPPMLNGDGKQTRDFIYVTDTADATVRIVKSKNADGKTINVASGKETSMKRVVDLICKYYGYNGKIIRNPARPGDVKRHLGSVKLARKLLGFKPKVGIGEGIRNTVEWYKENV